MSTKNRFHIDPIPNASDRRQFELNWLKKANPHYYEKIEKNDKLLFMLLVKKKKHLKE
jgi:hypothetical protein